MNMGHYQNISIENGQSQVRVSDLARQIARQGLSALLIEGTGYLGQS